MWIFEPQESQGVLDPHGDTDNYVDLKGYIYVLLIYGVIYITAIDMTIYQFIHIKLPEAPWQGPLLHPSLRYFPVTKITMPNDWFCGRFLNSIEKTVDYYLKKLETTKTQTFHICF